MKKGIGRLIIIIVVIAVAAVLLFFAVRACIPHIIKALVATTYDNVDTFTAEDEEILREYFNVTLVADMELVSARFIGARDYRLSIWYSIEGDINDLLEANHHYTIESGHNSVYDFIPEDSSAEYVATYFCKEGLNYLTIYKKQGQYIANFYTDESSEEMWDIRDKVFFRD